MRYIGNKTRLLPFILRTLKRSGIGVGSVHDAFAGTASVSRALKEKGWRVHSSDLLMSSYVFQRAYVVAEDADPLLGDMARDLSALPPRRAFISEHFSPSERRGAGTRMVYVPSPREVEPRPSCSIVIWAPASAPPDALLTRPLSVTGCWAARPAGTSAASHTVRSRDRASRPARAMLPNTVTCIGTSTGKCCELRDVLRGSTAAVRPRTGTRRSGR